jgi:hypothetical protein
MHGKYNSSKFKDVKLEKLHLILMSSPDAIGDKISSIQSFFKKIFLNISLLFDYTVEEKNAFVFGHDLYHIKLSNLRSPYAVQYSVQLEVHGPLQQS